MRTNDIICYGISGTIIAGLATYIASLKIESSSIYTSVFVLFLSAPALSCIVGGLRDYRVAAMVVVYTWPAFFLLER